MQEILSAKAAVEEHGPIVVATVEGLKTHLQEPLEKMLRVFRDPYEANRQDIDSILLTATLWNLESGSELLPRPAGENRREQARTASGVHELQQWRDALLA
ncbi:hypothetical protein PC111_g11052 [Phytophthora cactorum]|nr:hypothetical protein PC111_g11052 [Phytophthora cactorum]